MRESASDFTLQRTRLDDGRVVFDIRGAVDLFAAHELKRRLLEAVDGGAREIILDLTNTDFLDSTGLGALLTAHKRLTARGGQLVIVPGHPNVGRVFEITGLDSIFRFTSRAEALSSASAEPAAH